WLAGLVLLDGDSQRDDAAIYVVISDGCVSRSIFVLENDAETSSVGQSNAFAQAALPAQTVEGARDSARIGPAFGGFALESVDFLDDLNWDQGVVFLKRKDGSGVAQ